MPNEQDLPPSQSAQNATNVLETLKALIPDYLQQDMKPTTMVPNAAGKVPQLEPYSGLEQAAYGAADVLGAPMGAGAGAKAAATGAAKAAPLLKAIFAGPAALTADKAALSKAKDMVYASRFMGPSDAWRAPAKAFKETGWFQGPEGKWRFEIPDTKARTSTGLLRASDGGGVPLPVYIQHPELYEAYPTLKSMTVTNDAPARYNGMFYPGEGRIAMNPDLSRPERLSTGLHEIQHAVQGFEGLPPGTNPDAIQPLAHLQAKFMHGLPQDAILPSNLQIRADEAAREAYARHAGEVEARNVQSRHKIMSEWANGPHGEKGALGWSRQASPKLTEDRPTKEQIFPFSWRMSQPTDVRNAVQNSPSTLQTIEALLGGKWRSPR